MHQGMVAADPDDREMRRRALAKRLTGHGARTSTIYDLTGFTRNRQSRMRMRWRVPEDSRERGPAPTSFRRFFTAEVRAEASCAALICIAYAANSLRTGRKAPYESGDIDTGERLCEAYEAFRSHVRDTTLDIELFALIARGLTNRVEIRLARCVGCGAATLHDALSTVPPDCGMCEHED